VILPDLADDLRVLLSPHKELWVMGEVIGVTAQTVQTSRVNDRDLLSDLARQARQAIEVHHTRLYVTGYGYDMWRIVVVAVFTLDPERARVGVALSVDGPVDGGQVDAIVSNRASHRAEIQIAPYEVFVAHILKVLVDHRECTYILHGQLGDDGLEERLKRDVHKRH